jgi:hypothetical protein
MTLALPWHRWSPNQIVIVPSSVRVISLSDRPGRWTSSQPESVYLMTEK